MKTRICILLFLACLPFHHCIAQLLLENPSFEYNGAPSPHKAPEGWLECFTPDGQPGNWQCSTPPSSGSSYIGLIYEPNSVAPLPGELYPSHWIEGVGQRFDLKKGLTYEFTIDLAYSDQYVDANGNALFPGILQVFGGPFAGVFSNSCGPNNEDQVLLWASPVIAHPEWLTYPVTFTPLEDFQYILFKIQGSSIGNLEFNKSNVLLDNISRIKHNGPLEVRGIEDKTICQGECISLNGTYAEGGTWAYQYAWESIPVGFTSNQQDPGNVCPQADTKYILTVTDGQSTKKDTVEAVVKPSPAADAGSDVTICPGTSVQLTATGGTSYKWFPADGLDDPEKANPIASPLKNTTYTVVVRNGTECESSDQVEVALNPAPHAAFKYDKDSMVVQFYGTSENGAYQWLWDFGDRSTVSTEQNPVHVYANFNETYDVVLKVWNMCGIDSVIFPIMIDGTAGSGNVGIGEQNIQAEPNIYPNPFNEAVKIDYYLQELANVRLELYDITGRLIFTTPGALELPGIHFRQLNRELFGSGKGMYFIRLSVGKKMHLVPVVLE